MLLVEDKGSGVIVLLRLLRRGSKAFQAVQPQGYLLALELVPQRQVFLGLL